MDLISMSPIVNAFELEKAVNTRYGLNIDNIHEVLFDDHYYNNTYSSFDLDDIEEYDEEYMDPEEKEKVNLRNLIRVYLKDILPDWKYVLIDISWYTTW